MKIKSKIINKTMYILLSGELDEHSAEYTRRVMDTLFDTEKGFQQETSAPERDARFVW